MDRGWLFESQPRFYFCVVGTSLFPVGSALDEIEKSETIHERQTRLRMLRGFCRECVDEIFLEVEPGVALQDLLFHGSDFPQVPAHHVDRCSLMQQVTAGRLLRRNGDVQMHSNALECG